VLLDDRAASPGVAFKDAELIGIPTIVVVGKALGRGLVELRDRRTGTVAEVPIDAARQAILAEAGAITLL
jgi:prolyl-tRNA synthetase